MPSIVNITPTSEPAPANESNNETKEKEGEAPPNKKKEDVVGDKIKAFLRSRCQAKANPPPPPPIPSSKKRKRNIEHSGKGGSSSLSSSSGAGAADSIAKSDHDKMRAHFLSNFSYHRLAATNHPTETTNAPKTSSTTNNEPTQDGHASSSSPSSSSSSSAAPQKQKQQLSEDAQRHFYEQQHHMTQINLLLQQASQTAKYHLVTDLELPLTTTTTATTDNDDDDDDPPPVLGIKLDNNKLYRMPEIKGVLRRSPAWTKIPREFRTNSCIVSFKCGGDAIQPRVARECLELVREAAAKMKKKEKEKNAEEEEEETTTNDNTAKKKEEGAEEDPSSLKLEILLVHTPSLVFPYPLHNNSTVGGKKKKKNSLQQSAEPSSEMAQQQQPQQQQPQQRPPSSSNEKNGNNNHNSKVSTNEEEVFSKPNTTSNLWLQEQNEWQTRYQSLAQYKRLTGHCSVSPSENKALSDWITLQRTQNTTNNLRPSRIKKLNELGFDWVPRPTSSSQANTAELNRWTIHYNALVSYQKTHGHCNVAFQEEEDAYLAHWVQLQRMQLARRQMDAYRYSKLNQIGFDWAFSASSSRSCASGGGGVVKEASNTQPRKQQPRNDNNNKKQQPAMMTKEEYDWHQQFGALLLHREKHGNFHVSPWENGRLAFWIQVQREKKGGGEGSEKKEEREEGEGEGGEKKEERAEGEGEGSNAKKKKKKKKIEEWKEKMLNEIGFDWIPSREEEESKEKVPPPRKQTNAAAAAAAAAASSSSNNGAAANAPSWDEQYEALARFHEKTGGFFPGPGRLRDWLEAQNESIVGSSATVPVALERVEKLLTLGVKQLATEEFLQKLRKRVGDDAYDEWYAEKVDKSGTTEEEEETTEAQEENNKPTSSSNKSRKKMKVTTSLGEVGNATNYWQLPEAARLFGFTYGVVDVLKGLQYRVDLLRKANKSCDGWKNLVPNDGKEDLYSDSDITFVRHKALYLTKAYLLAMEHMNAKSWIACCKEAASHFEGLGLRDGTPNDTIRRWHAAFRKAEVFPHPKKFVEGQQPSMIFVYFPRAKELFIDIANKNSHQLTSYIMADKFATCILPVLEQESRDKGCFDDGSPGQKLLGKLLANPPTKHQVLRWLNEFNIEYDKHFSSRGRRENLSQGMREAWASGKYANRRPKGQGLKRRKAAATDDDQNGKDEESGDANDSNDNQNQSEEEMDDISAAEVEVDDEYDD